MRKTFLVMALILCTLPALLAQENGPAALPQVSEKTKAEWLYRYEGARNKRRNGWLWFASGAGCVALGAVDYSRRFDTVVLPGTSYAYKVENRTRRNLAIAGLAGGAALAVWGAIRVESGGSEMRTLEDERRNWGAIGFTPVPAGRGWMISYQRTF